MNASHTFIFQSIAETKTVL